ncbi:P-loop containing nucleoside triphosphate hydrolase protein [Delphinella strobiligena]|nr:P-loop containing nucleoside triphosphate hydrolase protein [Delphinella strobiligena]
MSYGGYTKLRIVLLGDVEVGKTTFRNRFVSNRFQLDYIPTAVDTQIATRRINGNICNLYIYDTSGNEEFRTSRQHAITLGRGFLIFYSVCSRKSFDRVVQFFNELRQCSGKGLQDITSTDSLVPPVIMLGNMNDRNDEREVSVQEARELAKELGCEHMETSAKNGVNITESFLTIASRLKQYPPLDCLGAAPIPFCDGSDWRPLSVVMVPSLRSYVCPAEIPQSTQPMERHVCPTGVSVATDENTTLNTDEIDHDVSDRSTAGRITQSDVCRGEVFALQSTIAALTMQGHRTNTTLNHILALVNNFFDLSIDQFEDLGTRMKLLEDGLCTLGNRIEAIERSLSSTSTTNSYATGETSTASIDHGSAR